MSDIAAIEAASDELVRASRRPRFGNTGVFLPVGILILAVFLAFAIAPGLIAPHDPIKLDITNQNLSPRPGHWLGTDQFGRDILSPDHLRHPHVARDGLRGRADRRRRRDARRGRRRASSGAGSTRS